jgi:membrane-associated phospholipid phosphatase
VKKFGMGSIANGGHAGGPSRTIGERLGAWPPPAIAATAAVTGSILLAIIMAATGFVITRSSLSPRIGGWDGSVERWIELHRTATLNTWTHLGSIMGGTGTILVVAGTSVAFMLIRRLWYDAGFLAMALFIEFSTFLATTTIINRPRPTIVPLDPIPVTSSFPSGHTGAAIATYVGLAIVLSSRLRGPVVRMAIWMVALGFPIYVGVSRVYRGMHHPTDVMASIVLGVGALSFALLAVRAAAVAADRRPPRRVEAPAPRERSEVRA